MSVTSEVLGAVLTSAGVPADKFGAEVSGGGFFGFSKRVAEGLQGWALSFRISERGPRLQDWPLFDCGFGSWLASVCRSIRGCWTQGSTSSKGSRGGEASMPKQRPMSRALRSLQSPARHTTRKAYNSRFAETCVIIDKLDKIGADAVKKELGDKASGV